MTKKALSLFFLLITLTYFAACGETALPDAPSENQADSKSDDKIDLNIDAPGKFLGDHDPIYPAKQEESGNFIGDKCKEDSQCPYDGGFCFNPQNSSESFCSLDCSRICPDSPGKAISFCVNLSPNSSKGSCISRCDETLFPDNKGCSENFSCKLFERNKEPGTIKKVCVPADLELESPEIKASDCSKKQKDILSDIQCFLEIYSFGDPSFKDLSEKFLKGNFNAGDGLKFLDKQRLLSKKWISSEIGSSISNNSSKGHPKTMRGMVVHYTANQNALKTIKYFLSKNSHASTHYMADWENDGFVLQLFDHRDRTWHAGSKFNSTHFGYDFINCGYLNEDNGSYKDYAKRIYQSDINGFGKKPIFIEDGIPGAETKYKTKKYWMPYSYRQILGFIITTRALHEAYSLKKEDIVRHGDVSSSRVDPGPALPLTKSIDEIFSKNDLSKSKWLSEYFDDPSWIIKNANAR